MNRSRVVLLLAGIAILSSVSAASLADSPKRDDARAEPLAARGAQQADDFELVWRSTSSLADAPASAAPEGAGSLGPASKVALSEDFESITQPALPPGWTTENPNGGFVFITADASTANTGGFWPITEHTVFAIANDDACNCDMSEVRLISPPISLVDAAEVSVEAWVWLDNTYGSDPFERGTIEIDPDGDGANWIEVFEIPPLEAWQQISVDLSEYRGNPAARIAFRFNDNGNWGRGLAVDDIVVRVSNYFENPDLFQSFESVTEPALPPGWLTSNPNGGFVFTTAQASTVNTGGFWPITEHTTFAVANDDACNCDMSDVRLISPQFNIQSGRQSVLEAWVWLDNVYGSDPFERGAVEIDPDGNALGWIEIFEIPPFEGWQRIKVDLGPYAGNPNARIAFRYDDNGNWGRGLAVDDVVVRPVIVFQDFEAVTQPALPAGWSSVNPNGGFIFESIDASTFPDGFWPITEHTQFAVANDDACNCNMSEVRLISPQIRTPRAQELVLSAWVWLDNVYGSFPFERGTVEIDPNGDGVGWFEVFDIPPLEAWQRIEVDLTAFSDIGPARIAFRFNDNGNWGRGLAVDDIEFVALGSDAVIFADGFESGDVSRWSSSSP